MSKAMVSRLGKIFLDTNPLNGTYRNTWGNVEHNMETHGPEF
jgi:hypothetical protein